MSAGRTVPVKQPPPPDMADIDAIAAEGERSASWLMMRVLVVIARELRLLRAGQRP